MTIFRHTSCHIWWCLLPIACCRLLLWTRDLVRKLFRKTIGWLWPFFACVCTTDVSITEHKWNNERIQTLQFVIDSETKCHADGPHSQNTFVDALRRENEPRRSFTSWTFFVDDHVYLCSQMNVFSRILDHKELLVVIWKTTFSLLRKQ